MTGQGSPVSLRLAALQHELELGAATALDEFWLEVTARGTPLIERIRGDDDQAIVTFLWRGNSETENVFIMSPLMGYNWHSTETLLVRMPHTDLWYGSYLAPLGLRVHYYFMPNFSRTPEAEQDELRYRRPDPLNPRRLVLAQDKDFGRNELVLSILELPSAEPQIWGKTRPGRPTGEVTLLRFRSTMLSNERHVWVYTPPDYTRQSSPYPLLLLFDGWQLLRIIPTVTILDNLIDDGLIPPLMAIFLDNLGHTTRLHELGGSLPFVDCLADEVLPWAHGLYAITSDPSLTIVGGISGGGFTAALAGLRRPEVFGNVLSNSGSFYWIPGVEMPQHQEDRGEEWLAQKYLESPTLPVRFYLDVGLWEGERQIVSNRRMKTALQAKGYAVQYKEFKGGHDYLFWENALADGLPLLLGSRGATP
jgi:enterochelin esterase family protein